MFHDLPNNPGSALSIIAAGFRLYFRSIFATLLFSVLAALSLPVCLVLFEYFNLPVDQLLVFATPLQLIWVIPLVKRIYGVGIRLPITLTQAFDGFWLQYFRLLLLLLPVGAPFVFLLVLSRLLVNIPQLMTVVLFLGLLAYLYWILGLYFAHLFVILEDDSVISAIQKSLRIETHHYWLSFSVIFGFSFVMYLVLAWIIPHFAVSGPLRIAIEILLPVVVTPLFLCIQICQFFNLKYHAGKDSDL